MLQRKSNARCRASRAERGRKVQTEPGCVICSVLWACGWEPPALAEVNLGRLRSSPHLTAISHFILTEVL